MLETMHRDTNANFYPMQTFKSMHRIVNFYVDASMRICESYHP